MQRRNFSRELKLEAVKLMKKCGVAVVHEVLPERSLILM
jgi:transposase-like protein